MRVAVNAPALARWVHSYKKVLKQQHVRARPDAEKPTFCYLLEGVEGHRFCDPAEMEGHKLRNALSNSGSRVRPR